MQIQETAAGLSACGYQILAGGVTVSLYLSKQCHTFTCFLYYDILCILCTYHVRYYLLYQVVFSFSFSSTAILLDEASPGGYFEQVG